MEGVINLRKIEKEPCKKTELKQQKFIKVSLIILIIISIIAIIIIVCKQKESLKNDEVVGLDEIRGLWNIDGVTKYEFDGKGRGKMFLPESNLEYGFSYKINNNEVSIDFDSEIAKDYTYKYSIDENILNLEGKTPGSGKLEMTRENK